MSEPNFCKHGHDKNVVGTLKSGFCRECGRAARRKQWASATPEQKEHVRAELRRRYREGLTQTNVTRFICRNGHDKRIVGTTKNGGCKQCFTLRDAERRAEMTPEQKTKLAEQAKVRYERWKASGSFRSDVRRQHLQYQYNLTEGDYKKLLEQQNGLCAICQRPERMIRRGALLSLHVDHDHISGLVRALLCSDCNTGIGTFGDNPDLLEAAAAYVRRFRQLLASSPSSASTSE